MADQRKQSALDSCPWGPMRASWHCDVGARPELGTWNWEMGLQCGLGGGANQARAGIQSVELLEAGGLEVQTALSRRNLDVICLIQQQTVRQLNPRYITYCSFTQRGG